jgi:hypothetical protein
MGVTEWQSNSTFPRSCNPNYSFVVLDRLVDHVVDIHEHLPGYMHAGVKA